MPELTRDQREAAVKQTFGSFALEGLHPSSQTRAGAQAYINGTKSIDQLVEETRARHGCD